MRLGGRFFSLVLLLAMGSASQVWANSVEVSNSSLHSIPGLGPFETGPNSVFDCQQSGVSSASCTTGSSSIAPPYLDSGGTASGTAAFGHVGGSTVEGNAQGRVVTSFSDNVVVRGGNGIGTLVSHYSLVAEGEAYGGAPAGFVFVQGGSRTGVEPSYQYFGLGPAPNPPLGCEYVGYCFSQTFDVATPVQFGVATALGAQLYLGTAGGTLLPPRGDTTAYGSIVLNGYTVLGGAGNVVSDAAVTRQNLPGSFNLDFAPEPGTWGLMVMGLAGLVVWRWRRKAVLPIVAVAAVAGMSPAWANSVYVTNSSGHPSAPSFVAEGTPVPYCQQSGTSSAGCATDVSGRVGPSPVSSNGNVDAHAAFGALSGGFAEYNGSSGYFVSSFGDEVLVTGGSGSGTLVTHYSLASSADASADATGGAKAGRFSFVQGSTTTGLVPSFTSFGYTPPLPNPPPPGCQPYGLCFSENFDVTSPVQFGTALPLGAEASLNSDEFGARPFPPGDIISASSTLQLTGYTVLDASGNVIGDAVVTQQHVAGLDLFPTPEPETWALMLMGFAGLMLWRWRRVFGRC